MNPALKCAVRHQFDAKEHTGWCRHKAPMTIKLDVIQMRNIPGGRFTMGRTYEIEDPHWVFQR